MNNVVANSQTGIAVDTRSNLTVIGGSAYFQNDINATSNNVGTLPLTIASTVDVFVNPISLVFTPRAGVSLIDSSVDSLLDRSSLTVVKNAVGIPPSPILAPIYDVNGQLRVDDPAVNSPPGVGENVFKDRGAADRGDQNGPRAILVSPFAPEIGTGSNQAITATGSIYDSFKIQLVDGIGPAEPAPGVGIDDGSVNGDSILVSRDGVRLVQGRDYTIGYDASNNVLRITPTAGIWIDNSTYTVSILGQADKVLKFGDATTLTDGRITVLRGDNATTIARLEAELGITISIVADPNLALDGQTIDVFDGTNTITFEIDSDDAVTDINTPVSVSSTATPAEVAAALAAAIDASTLNLTVNLPSTDTFGIPVLPVIQLLGPSTLSSVTRLPGITDALSIFRVAGSIGTEFGFGLSIATDGAELDSTLVVDGDQFTIARNGNLLRTFELSADGIVTEGATAIAFNPLGTVDDLANAIVAAIIAENLNLNPVNLGEGRISLGGDATFAVDTNATGLTAVGIAGQGASTPVVIPIGANGEDVAALYDARIKALGLAGVGTEIIGDRILLSGVSSVTGAGDIGALYTQDRVGNFLQANSDNGRTELTIFVGGGFDFGDALAPFKSTRAEGGPMARVDDGFQFGDTNTPDSDALIDNADEDDGITFVSGTAVANSTAEFTVMINADRAFYVDVWVDWNGDGIFTTATDVRRYRSTDATVTAGRGVLQVGSNTIALPVPADAKSGTRVVRFRLSESATLGVNGTATEISDSGATVIGAGEISDMPILVQSNPYQNALTATDVNVSGTVTPLDALNIINLLAQYKNQVTAGGGTFNNSIPLNPVPAGMTSIINGTYKPDVNGDGMVTPLDALRVINFLSANRRTTASGEGEAASQSFYAVGNGLLASPLTVATNNVTESNTNDNTVVQASVPVVTPAAATSSSSVFDSANVVALDDVLDDIANDGRVSSDSETDAVDSVFAGLGFDL